METRSSTRHDEIRRFNYLGDLQTLTGKVVKKYQSDGMNLVDVVITANNQRDEETAIAEATIALPAKDGKPVVFPEVPKDLQEKAFEFMAEHNRLKYGAV